MVDADLKSYFDTIPHEQLLERIKEKVSDGRVISLVESFLNQDIMEDMDRWTPTAGNHNYTDTVVIRFPDLRSLKGWYQYPYCQQERPKPERRHPAAIPL